MATETEKYTTALQNFSYAIEALAESIQQNVKSQSTTLTNAIGNNSQLFSELAKISDELLIVKDDTTIIKENTSLILKEIRSLKKDNAKKGNDKKGLVNELSGKLKSKEMVDGIKNVSLMAGSILAVGAAFSILKNVNFSTVLAFGIALPLIAYSFEKIGRLDMTPKKYADVGMGLVIMSASLLMSGEILKTFPVIGIREMLSMIGVSIGISIAMIGMSTAAQLINFNKISNVLLLASVMPTVAAGVVLSGHVLQRMPTVTLSQAWSAILTSVALGSVLIPLGYAAKLTGNKVDKLIELAKHGPIIMAALVGSGYVLKLMPTVTLGQTWSAILTSVAISAAIIPLAFAYKLTSNMDVKDWLILQATLPIAAATLVTSALILQLLSFINLEEMKLIKYSLAVGTSTFIMGMVLASYNKVGLTPGVALRGGIAMAAVSGAMLISSWLLNLGTYDNHPSLKWALGVGASLLVTLPTILAYGFVALTGVGAVAIALGIASMLGVARGLVDVSHIISQGNYSGGPSLNWALGVGASLGGFGMAALGLGVFILGTLGLGKFALDSGLEYMKKIAYTMNDVGAIISRGNYSGGPSAEWGMGVGTAILAFAQAVSAFKPGFLDTISSFFGGEKTDNVQLLMNIASAMPLVASVLREGDYSGGPTSQWAEGTAKSIKFFAEGIAALADEIDYDDVSDWIIPMMQIGKLMPFYANLLDGVTFGSSAPNKQWSEGIRDFINAMAGIKSRAITEQNITNIKKLSNVFVTLSESIRQFSKALWSLNGAPSLTSVYEGIALLSVIDVNALNNVLDNLNDQDIKVKKVISTVTSVGDGSSVHSKINTKSKMPKPKGKPNSKPEGNINKENQLNVKAKSVDVKPVNKTDELLTNIKNLISESKKILAEIASNTTSEKKSTYT